MDKMIVPANFQSWPKLADLLPDQKLIARELWCNQFVRLHGCYELPLGMFSKALNIQEAAVTAALQDFQKRGLVDWDEQTGEIYIRDWLRFHTFKGWAITNYWEGVRGIQSDRLRTIVEDRSAIAGLKDPAKTLHQEKSVTCSPTPTPTPTPTPEPTSISTSTSTTTTASPPPAVGGGGEAQEILPQAVSDQELDDFVCANVWYKKSSGGTITSPIGFPMAIRERIRRDGPNDADWEALKRWNQSKAGGLKSNSVPGISPMKPATPSQLATGTAMVEKIRQRVRGSDGNDDRHDQQGQR